MKSRAIKSNTLCDICECLRNGIVDNFSRKSKSISKRIAKQFSALQKQKKMCKKQVVLPKSGGLKAKWYKKAKHTCALEKVVLLCY